MSIGELPALVRAARIQPREQPLCCPCWGKVELDGPGEAPGTVRYLCRACGTVRPDLSDMVPVEARRP